mgnify:FL=1
MVFFNGYYPVLSDSVYVVMDDRQGGYGAVGSLVKKGHKKIAGIFKSDDIQGMERYSGYIQAIIDNGLEFKDEWVYWFNSENRQYIFTDEKARIIEMFQECTAVVCYNDEIAVKLVNLFKSSGYRIPQDKAIMSFDNSLLSEISSPHLTSLDHPKEILGAVAARKIVSMINGKKEKSVKLEWGISLKDST